MKRLCSVILLWVWLTGSISSVTAQDGDNRPVITPGNAHRITQLAELGRGWLHKLAWSPDGTQLAVASSNGVFLYNTADWNAPPRVLPEHERSVINVAWSPDGDQLAYVDAQGYVRLWEIASGNFIQKTEDLVQPELFEGGDPYYRDERKNLLSRSLIFDKQGTVLMLVAYNAACVDECIWDASHGRYLVEGTDYQAVQDVGVFPDGSGLKLGTRTSLISPNGQLVAVAICTWDRECSEGIIDLYDAATGSLLREILTPHVQYSHENINRLVFSPDSQQIVAGGCVERAAPTPKETQYFDSCARYQILVFDVETGEEVIKLDGGFFNAIESSEYSPDGKLLAASDGSLFYVWDALTGQQVAAVNGYGGPVRFFAFHPSGDYFVSGHSNGNYLVSAYSNRVSNLWDEQSWITGKPLATLLGTGPFAFSPDGVTLAAGNLGNYFYSAYTEAMIWNIANPTTPELISDPRVVNVLERVVNLDFRADGSLLATSGEGVFLIIWDRQKDTLIKAPNPYYNSSTVLSPDETTVAMISYNAIVIFKTDNLLALDNGTLNPSEPEHKLELSNDAGFTALGFSPDGTLLATLSKAPFAELLYTYTVYFWDVTTGTMLEQIDILPAANLSSLAFSPDGGLLAVGGCAYYSPIYQSCDEGIIWLFDTENGREVRYLRPHTEEVNALAFSPDGTLLVSGSGSRTDYMHHDNNAESRIYVWGIPSP